MNDPQLHLHEFDVLEIDLRAQRALIHEEGQTEPTWFRLYDDAYGNKYIKICGLNIRLIELN